MSKHKDGLAGGIFCCPFEVILQGSHHGTRVGCCAICFIIIVIGTTTNTYQNKRITFDKNIGVSRDVGRFFDRDIHAIPTMETGAHILEVKYDELLPDYIRKIVDFGSLHKTAFSKYYYARQIKEGNGDIL